MARRDLGVAPARTDDVVTKAYADTPSTRQSLTTQNLNTILQAGRYRQASSTNASPSLNYPVMASGLLEVFSEPNGAGYIKVTQRYTASDVDMAATTDPLGNNQNGPRTWDRWQFDDGSWTPWSETARIGHVHAISDVFLARRIMSEALAAGTNLNNLQVTGQYYQRTTANATLALNYPLAGRTGVLEVRAASQDFADGVIPQDIVQRYLMPAVSPEVTPRVFQRSSTDGTTWTAWLEVANAGPKTQPVLADVYEEVPRSVTSSSTTVQIQTANITKTIDGVADVVASFQYFGDNAQTAAAADVVLVVDGVETQVEKVRIHTGTGAQVAQSRLLRAEFHPSLTMGAHTIAVRLKWGGGGTVNANYEGLVITERPAVNQVGVTTNLEATQWQSWLYNTTYNLSVTSTSWITMTGTAQSVMVKAGQQIEVSLEVPLVDIPANTGLQLRMATGGTVFAYDRWLNFGTASVSMPGTLVGFYVNNTASDVLLDVRVEVRKEGNGSPTLQYGMAGSGTTDGAAVRYRYRLLSSTTVPSPSPIVVNREIGEIAQFSSLTLPSGWLAADGAAISRNTYADLFAVIGTTYGAGDGSTTFNLPNLAGRFAAGYAAGDTDHNALGKTGGAKTHTHTLTTAWAQITAGSSITGVILRRITASFTPTHKDSNTVAGTTSTTAQTTAAGLGGSTDSGSSLSPYMTVLFAIKAFRTAAEATQQTGHKHPTADIIGLSTYIADTGWVAITAASGYESYDPALYPLQVRRIGNVVRMRGLVRPTGVAWSAGASVIVANIATTYRPLQNVFVAAGTSAGATAANVYVATTGDVVVRTATGQTPAYVSLDCSWLVD